MFDDDAGGLPRSLRRISPPKAADVLAEELRKRIRTGEWPQRLHDVEEMETVILHEQQYLREHGEAPPGSISPTKDVTGAPLTGKEPRA